MLYYRTNGRSQVVQKMQYDELFIEFQATAGKIEKAFTNHKKISRNRRTEIYKTKRLDELKNLWDVLSECITDIEKQEKHLPTCFVEAKAKIAITYREYMAKLNKIQSNEQHERDQHFEDENNNEKIRRFLQQQEVRLNMVKRI